MTDEERPINVYFQFVQICGADFINTSLNHFKYRRTLNVQLDDFFLWHRNIVRSAHATFSSYICAFVLEVTRFLRICGSQFLFLGNRATTIGGSITVVRSGPHEHPPLELCGDELELLPGAAQDDPVLGRPARQVGQHLVEGAVRHGLVHRESRRGWKKEFLLRKRM